MRTEAEAQKLVLSRRAQELRVEVKPFSDAATAFIDWADGEHADHPATAARLRTSFVSLRAFFRNSPVSTILRGQVNDYKAWRRKEHKVREITLRYDLHALSKAFACFIDHNWARENPVRSVEIPSDKDAVRMHVLTAIEEALFFEAAKRFPALYDLGRLMLNQGCRPEEILELSTDDIDLEQSRLTRPASEGGMHLRLFRVPGSVPARVRDLRFTAHVRHAQGGKRNAGCDAGRDPRTRGPAQRDEVRPCTARSDGPRHGAI